MYIQHSPIDMSMPDFPAHTSPALTPAELSKSQQQFRAVSDLELSDNADPDAPPPLISPAFTPPDTPPGREISGQRHDRQPKGIPVDHETSYNQDVRRASLVDTLPEVQCEVRARIPLTSGTEMWLHLYHNNVDDKEHLAIVFGPHIRSKSLDAVRPGETERDRMIRGAYIGTLFPGRTSSKLDHVSRDTGVPSSRGSATDLAVLSNQYGPQPSANHQISEEPPIGRSARQTNFDAPLVRIHSECYTGETVWSARCDCGEQLDEAQRLMSLPTPTPGSTPVSNGQTPLHERLPSSGGVIIYLRQEGRGIGLLSKLKAYNLQDLGHDTMEANLLLRHPGDARSYGLATAMLLDLGLGGPRGIRLLTNNPEKVRAVEGPHREIRVVERVPMIPLSWKTGGKEGFSSPELERYIATKIGKFNHEFT